MASVFINEIHYDNVGTDIDEFIEIAGIAGTDLTGWSLVLYNGTDSQRSPYDTRILSGTLTDQGNGFGTLVIDYPTNGIQNGSPDGIALVDNNGNVVQFLSYEGSFVAASGPAAGLTSTDIGVSETASTAVGFSLQLTGSGSQSGDFTWSDPTTATPGAFNLGQTFGGASGPAAPLINEFVFNHTGSDTREFVEIFADANTDYSGFSLLQIEGDGSTAGLVDSVFTIGSTDASGFWTTGFQSNVFENGTVTLLLVENFAGSVGDDLDLDNDGVVDVIAWDRLVDSVAVSDGGSDDRTYAAATLIPGFDGLNDFTVGGASRIPNGVDTDTANDWVRNDFELAGIDGNVGTPEIGEAFNTPRAENAVVAETDLIPITAAIYDIQGAAQVSALVGERVLTSGIVTAVDSNGFYVQDPTGDGNIATSDGIFVFTGSRPSLVAGDAVQIEGTVSEFIPGGASTGNLSTTQISGSLEITVLSSGNALPESVILGRSGRVPPHQIIDNDGSFYNVLAGGGVYEPTTDGIDFYESLEGMRVTVEDAVAVSGTNRFGEIFTVANQGADATGLSDRGTINIAPDDFNPERIQIQEDTGILNLANAFGNVNTGDTLGNVTGVVSYNFGNYEVLVTEDFTANIQSANLQAEVSRLKPVEDGLTVASYNVLNLDPNDQDGDTDVADGRFEAIAQQIVNNLNAPDIISLQEVQDNDGSVNSNVTAANETLQRLVDAIAAAGGPTYTFVDNPFIGDDTSGGQPGGNIRTAFLYNSERVSLAGNPQLNNPFAGSIQTVVDPLDQQTNPNNPFFDTRLPLVGYFSFAGQTIAVVNNHFSSKGGSSPLFGQTQPAANLQEDPSVNGSLDQRRAQAQAVIDYLDHNNLLNNPNAKAIVLGDLNEFEFISPVEDILGGSLNNLTNTLPANERYTFNFDGNSQSLDHILVSDALLAGAEFDIVHVNTEFAETAGRASDHDPLLARFDLEGAPVGGDDDEEGDELRFGGRRGRWRSFHDASPVERFRNEPFSLGMTFSSVPVFMGENLLAGFAPSQPLALRENAFRPQSRYS
ncbi:endonuclease/exonuclease/phosphatase family protein [Almyronema epifaneia]|uniref:Endonuclease/exonuclease/phosphatase family protein n=1 Tax=Almyronema epifaneia S1 TaxID=2991925 RepID=A0ABW6IDJ4_9CYAN